MKKAILIIAAVLVLLAGVWAIYSFRHQPAAAPQPAPEQAVPETVPAPASSEATTTEAAVQPYADLIQLASPQSGQAVDSPISLSGQARGSWFFEGSFPVTLYDDDGNVLVKGYATAGADWMTEDFVPFLGEISYQSSSTMAATLVLANDNPSGLPENSKKIEIPLVLKPAAAVPADSDDKLMDIKVYFMNDDLDKEMTCTKAFPVSRRILRTESVAAAALNELLKGPNDVEKVDGYSTSINDGVKLKKVTIVDGVAKADFTSTLEKNVGGSCRVASIRAQITETLKQFPTVQEVVISIDGRTEDILQP